MRIRAVDPLGGTARLLAAMPKNSYTTIIEIEPEFVAEGWEWMEHKGLVSTWSEGLATESGHGRLSNGAKFEYIVGDSIKVLHRRKKMYTHIITSPSYGNRFDDAYNSTPGRVCRSYAQSKGGPLSEGNGAAFSFFTAEYWDLHLAVMRAAIDRLEIDGKLLLNVSDFYKTLRKGEKPTRIGVVPAWIRAMTDCGLVMYAAEPIVTRRYKYGENRHRTEHEMLLTFKKVS